MSVRFGIVGSGTMALVYAEALATQVDAGHLVAIAGGRRAPGLAADYGVEAVGSPEALFARPDVDVVVIATPHTTHLPYTVAAAAAGKHVYVEKPMAVTVAECDAMIAACRAAGVLLTVAKQSRQNPTTVEAKRLIDAGEIGEVRMVRMLSSTVGWDVSPDSWIGDPKEGGAYLDWGVHGVDALRWLTGANAVRAFAQMANYGGLPAPDTSAMVHYVMDSGAMVQVWMSYEFPPPGLGTNFQFMIVGSKGMLDLHRYVLKRSTDDGWVTIFEWEPWDWVTDAKNERRIGLTARQVQQFTRAVERGEPLVVTGDEGRAAVEMIEAAQRSARTGEAVAIPLGT
ncbi:MAG TPA: Gfo/Idh/MocA family oxidoreductase [Candidatus Limnocylindrales bacterium]|jgi:predicted dehydrogenase|nr:Gfo/Idh/MocA family oxidoreductase [Candidatus Limnocylindrales bacterium]